MTGKKRVFVDMDGVLCEYKDWVTGDDLESEGYFASLAPRRAMVDAVKYLIENGDAEVFVLSSVIPRIEVRAREEKNEWLDRFLPQIDMDHRIYPLCGTDKSKALGSVSSSDILLDDHSPNLHGWCLAGGTGVKILNEINGRGGTFTSGLRVRITRKEELAEIVEAV